MQATAGGDVGAFGELVRRHQRTAWNAAWRLLGDAAEAEDAAQNAFLNILEAAPRYRPTASFRTYLYCIVTRLCLDRLKKKQPVYVNEVPASPSGQEPPDLLVQRERAETVRRALDGLPPRQRAALVLRHYEDLSYREIAGALDTSVKSVEHLIARAREALANRLDDLRPE